MIFSYSLTQTVAKFSLFGVKCRRLIKFWLHIIVIITIHFYVAFYFVVVIFFIVLSS